MNPTTSKYRTLIADDEQPARDRLKKLLAEHADQIELIGDAQNGLECRKMIDRLKPDLVFLDIQMPGLNGFVGEFLVFRGVFGLAPWAAALGCLGLFATAFFLLTFWQRVFHGPQGADVASFRDLNQLELLTLLPTVALMFVLGVWPQLLVSIFNPLVTAWAAHLP